MSPRKSNHVDDMDIQAIARHARALVMHIAAYEAAVPDSLHVLNRQNCFNFAIIIAEAKAIEACMDVLGYDPNAPHCGKSGALLALQSLANVIGHMKQKGILEGGEYRKRLPDLSGYANAVQTAVAMLPTNELSAAWTTGESITEWAKVFRVHRNTMRELFKGQRIRNEKLSVKLYRVAVADLPSNERANRYRRS